MIDKKITGELMALAVARNDWLGWEENLATRINRIIRAHDDKVLDVVVEAVNKASAEYDGDMFPSLSIDAINKLRPRKQ